MASTQSDHDVQSFLANLPASHRLRYSREAQLELLNFLDGQFEKFLIPLGLLSPSGRLQELSKYTKHPTGKICGHIFRSGEASYNCRTCSNDDIHCLCSDCFNSSDHSGHAVRLSISNGSNSWCDCGDSEAWPGSKCCRIQSEVLPPSPADLPPSLRLELGATVGSVLDFICDVMYCAPEKMAHAKALAASEEHDINISLWGENYGRDCEPCYEYSLIIWNAEKHTVDEVQDHIARACKMSMAGAKSKALETDAFGRSILYYSQDLAALERMAKILETIRVTTTIRPSRDTFREQMCGTMVAWLYDNAGRSIGGDLDFIYEILASELLRPWRHETKARQEGHRRNIALDSDTLSRSRTVFPAAFNLPPGLVDTDMTVDRVSRRINAPDHAHEVSSHRLRGSQPAERAIQNHCLLTRLRITSRNKMFVQVNGPGINTQQSHTGPHWLDPSLPIVDSLPLAEDLSQRVRLDWLLFFDIRMWKQMRIDLKSIYISTAVHLPHFKQVFGLRLTGIYISLAQRYLISDREPDHSIINISLQILSTPSITLEVVEKSRFMTTLMAIIYTFRTSREVGLPSDISPEATLTLESGTATNRRLYHFYADLKYLLGSTPLQKRIQQDERYLLQFLDLARLHQGICPHTRAVGEHIEFETDSWITAQLVTRQINAKAKQFTESFRHCTPDAQSSLRRAIRLSARAVIRNSIGEDLPGPKGLDAKRPLSFKVLSDFEFDSEPRDYKVVDYVVEGQPMSFHHVLHYILSWMVEHGRHFSIHDMRENLNMTYLELHDELAAIQGTDHSGHLQPEDYLMAAFDFPLRVCAWLAQIKANMWIRNGISLRHQASTYRAVLQRDVSYQRDIFLLQTALVVCDPSRVLVSFLDRFGLECWAKGIFTARPESQDESQSLDVVEDFVHLLIILLSDRGSLLTDEDEPRSKFLAMRRDLIHVLCFKPLSFNEICREVPEKYPEQPEFLSVLRSLSKYKPPEGVYDTGTFELQKPFIEEVDPYFPHYSKTQREESELALRLWMALKTGDMIENIVHEPTIPPIPSGVFKDLAAFSQTGIFAQIIYYCLQYSLAAPRVAPSVPLTRIETFLNLVLHLVFIAISEDQAIEEEEGIPSLPSFVHLALASKAQHKVNSPGPNADTIAALLDMMLSRRDFDFCHAKVLRVLERARNKRPYLFQKTCSDSLRLHNYFDPKSEPNYSAAEEQRGKKKLAALSRQAEVMAHFQQQQQSFIERQDSMNWESNQDDTKDASSGRRNVWKYPEGTCILCQDATDDRQLFGTFALFSESRVLKQTDLHDVNCVRNVCCAPSSLDRSSQASTQSDACPETGIGYRSDSNGFPAQLCRVGSASVGCGHIMHFSCFEGYYESTLRRHTLQIARHHPENSRRLEFVCPLCKALGNSFLPIIWKDQAESYPGPLHGHGSLKEFLDSQNRVSQYLRGTPRPVDHNLFDFKSYANSTTVGWKPDMATGGEPVLRDGRTSPPRPTYDKRFEELKRVYRRLSETFQRNGLFTRYKSLRAGQMPTILGGDTLVGSVGYSISSVEIHQRGVDSEDGTLLDKIPEHVLTQLRILAENARAYIAFGTLWPESESQLFAEFQRESERQHCQLFAAQYFGRQTDYARRPMDTYPPLLGTDIFLFLSECIYGVMGDLAIEFANMLRLCYLADIVKTVFLMCRHLPVPAWIHGVNSDGDRDCSLANFRAFFIWVASRVVDFNSHNAIPSTKKDKSNESFADVHLHSLRDSYKFVKKYALIFLRKTAILVHVIYGVNLHSDGHQSLGGSADELDRLSQHLRVPSFDQMCSSLTELGQAHGWPSAVTGLAEGWIRHQEMSTAPQADSDDLPSSARMSDPGILELVSLPESYDAMIVEAARLRCPTTGGDLSDPVMCLFCGAFVCGQGRCCTIDQPSFPGEESVTIGGARRHMMSCHRNLGLFINVRKCSSVYLFHSEGSFGNPPYTDEYGEVDYNLRHGRRLFLNEKRYNTLLRNMFLGHGIPSFISRKLEAEINNGGWETL